MNQLLTDRAFLSIFIPVIIGFMFWMYFTFVVHKDNTHDISIRNMYLQGAAADYMELKQLIAEAVTPVLLEDIKGYIQHFENHYIFLVPRKIVQDFTVELYGNLMKKIEYVSEVKEGDLVNS